MNFKLWKYSGDISFLEYSNGRVAFSWNDNEGMPLATITVNLPDIYLEEDETIIDTNNMNNIWEVIPALIEQWFISEYVRDTKSGYCSYPIYKLTQEVLDII